MVPQNLIRINLERDSLFDAHGLQRLKDSYMRQEETSPQERFSFVAASFSSDLNHAQRIYDYASKHWLSFSTPILSFGRTKRGLPISCFLPYLPDTSDGLVDTSTECRLLSMAGGGIGLGLGIRSSDDKSTGVIPHLKTYDADSLAYKQGSTRRGSIASYLDISHPDIVEFLDIRKPTGGDPDRKCLNLHHGINITDDFMFRVQALSSGKMPGTDVAYPPEWAEEYDKWPLVDPNTKKIKQIVSVKELWQKILINRMTTGEPYLHFIDTSNASMPQAQKDLGLSIKQSNLCSEIILPTDEQRTAVCCLSSLNLEYWDEWKDNQQFVEDVVEFLDNVIEYFINNAPAGLSRAVYSASRERSIGIGGLGWHALLQRKSIPFESALAVSLNKQIWKKVRHDAELATQRLAGERGPCPDANGTARRNMCLIAIAPNASSSIIVGNTSPSIEPYRANVFVQDTLSGSFVYKNKYLKKLLGKHNQDTDEVWSSIIQHKGSVQHLEFLDSYERDVFKTFIEIDQHWVVQHAADRQEYVDQAQSVNLAFPPDVDVPYLHNVHVQAWNKNLKTLYYCRSEAISRADKVGMKIERKIITEDNCLACE